MAVIINGTTPTIRYCFKRVDVADIATAYLTIKSSDGTVLEKDLSTATIGDNTLSWKLSQEETLSLTSTARIMLNWVLGDGTRGASEKTTVLMDENDKDEVI